MPLAISRKWITFISFHFGFKKKLAFQENERYFLPGKPHAASNVFAEPKQERINHTTL